MACALGLITQDDFLYVFNQYLDPNGFLLRYPGTGQYMSYDDNVGAASVSSIAAVTLSRALLTSDGSMPDGNWIGRFPLLEPTLRAGACYILGPENEGKAIAAYAENAIFDPSTETSGKILLWLAAHVLCISTNVKLAIAGWAGRMQLEYPGGLEQMLAIYYPAGHPFLAAAQGKSFSPFGA